MPRTATRATVYTRKHASENSIVKSILSYLNAQPDCIAEKIQGNCYSSGKADINASICGLCVKIEVKTETGVATPLQLAYLDKWKEKGAVTMIARGKDSVAMTVERIREKEQFLKEYRQAIDSCLQ